MARYRVVFPRSISTVTMADGNSTRRTFEYVISTYYIGIVIWVRLAINVRICTGVSYYARNIYITRFVFVAGHVGLLINFVHTPKKYSNIDMMMDRGQYIRRYSIALIHVIMHVAIIRQYAPLLSRIIIFTRVTNIIKDSLILIYIFVRVYGTIV